MSNRKRTKKSCLLFKASPSTERQTWVESSGSVINIVVVIDVVIVGVCRFCSSSVESRASS